MSKYKSQLRKLYLYVTIEGLSLGGASWVALLALRGFSLSQIGIIEAIFHIVSLIAEIPSGAVADVLGRKRTMFAGRLMAVISAAMMIMSSSFVGVAIAIAINALSYNLASGTREALAYDSLKTFGKEEEYNKFASNGMMIYRIGTGLSTLLAGLALYLGYRKAYSVDIVIYIIGMLIVLLITDYTIRTGVKRNRVLCGIKKCITDSIAFLRANPKAIWLIAINSLVGAVSTLLLFFLQAKLPEMGLSNTLLGPALFFMTLGAAIGSKVVMYCKKMHFKTIAVLACLGIVLALASLFLRNPYIVILGGFIAAFSDDFMEVRADVILNDMIPSKQRATLISVCSFSFSAVMIILSPMLGKVLELI